MQDPESFQKSLLASKVQTCPRRLYLGPWAVEDFDKWRLRQGVVTCSFCGSMHPEEALFRIEQGVEVIPTDKPYKAYIGHSGGWKLYFQHLDEAQQQRFIDLYNNRTMRVGYPYRFYVLPYFVAVSSSKTTVEASERQEEASE